ncbi:MAG: hypothetical protein ACM3PE_03135 [Deltaproteobacteria bacterium]
MAYFRMTVHTGVLEKGAWLGMISIQIEEKDIELLRETINKYMVDLRREISRTDRHEHRDYLVGQEILLKRMLEQLPK